MWTEVRIKIGVVSSVIVQDVISSFLFDKGASGVEEKKGELRASFDSGKVKEIFRKELRSYLNSIKKEYPDFRYRVRILRLKHTGWAEKWKRYFKPVKVSKAFVVKPSWERCKALEGEIIIEINPGMAFGTGLHPTTRMVLKGLEFLVKRKKIAPEEASFLDVGTGTGILAIAAKKLGFLKVTAIDVDKEALEIARENISGNLLNGMIEVSPLDIGAVKDSFNLVAANITAGEIMAIWKEIVSKVRYGGFLILSGILQKQEKEFLNGILCDKLKLVKRFKEKEWSALVVRKELR